MSGWVAGAVVTSAVIGGVASMAGADAQAEAGENASEASLTATRETNAMMQEQYEQGREDLEPWRLAGINGLEAIMDNPSFQFDTQIFADMADPKSDFNFEREDYSFEKDPSYDFRMQEGIDALDSSASARGRLLSGAQDRAITRYGQDFASNEYDKGYTRHQQSEMDRYNQEMGVYNANTNRQTSNALNQYNVERGIYDSNLNTQQSLANVGQTTANQLANSGNQTAGAIASNTMSGTTASNNALLGSADATATGYSGVATSLNQGIGNALLGTKVGAFS